MKFLHTMVRVTDLEKSLDFYVTKMGLKEVRRMDSEQGRFTLVFLAGSDDLATCEGDMASTMRAPCLELTYNWDPETLSGGRNFGHLAYAVDDIYEFCQRMMDVGVTINRPPRDGHMAFIRSPDDISFEILQKGESLEICEPWASMENIGEW